MTALEEAWEYQERWAKKEDEDALCLLNLRRRVDALEQRAATEQSSATEPAPAADRPLWVVMKDAFMKIERPLPHQLAAEIDAVADWLAAREHCGAASALRAEARLAREGA